MSSSMSESKYLVTSSPSEAVSASIPLIHSRSCIWTRKGGRGGGGGGAAQLKLASPQ